MECLGCGHPDTKIKDSMDSGPEIRRERTCGACGARFFTDEVPDPRTLRMADGSRGRPRPSQERANPRKGTPQERPPPSQDPPPAGQVSRGGVGGALSGDQGPEQNRSLGKWRGDPEIWGPDTWRSKYGQAWTNRYQRFYGQPTDTSGCSRLEDFLERLPRDEILEYQRLAPEMFQRFLADEAPKVVSAKHPFAFFVTAFASLRPSPAEQERPAGAGPGSGKHWSDRYE